MDMVYTLVVLKQLGYSILFNILITFVTCVIASRVLWTLFSNRKVQKQKDNPELTGSYVPHRWKKEFLHSFGSIFAGLFTDVLMDLLKAKGYYVLLDDDPQFNLSGARFFALIASQFLMYFVLFDLYYYMLHRFFLHNKRFWYIHRVHHESFTPNIMTGFSFHPIEAFVTGIFPHVMAIALCKMHSLSLVCVTLFGLSNTMIVHLGYELYPTFFLKSKFTNWFLTTTFHDIHHSKVNYNFGGFTTIWDHCFGTVYPDFEKELNSIIGTCVHVD
jgi:sterol desaturase/sphingolipid hydroxylase (fatty acid hydroxylase superfamily)